MREFRYEPSAVSVPSGRVVFQLANRGQQGHQPTLITVPDDVPPILEQLRGSTRRSIDVLVNNPGLRPGVTGAIAVDLKPGVRYAFVCFAETQDAKLHSILGMAWEFRAGSGPSILPKK
jgi:hypothetical protein